MFIQLFKKYLFALIVSSYVLTVIGIPVYHHYCSGELETISYVVKSNSCCGEEESSEPTDNGCCKDENLILKSSVDFTIKDLNDYTFVKSFNQVFYILLPFSNSRQPIATNFNSVYTEFPPPKLQHDLLISTSVLRI